MAWYNRGKHIILDPSAAAVGEPPLALLLDEVVIGLMRASYTFDPDHAQYDDITADSLVADDYFEPGTATAHELAGKAITVDDPNDRAEFDATDLEFTGIGNGTNDTFDAIVVCRQQDAGEAESNTELLGHIGVNSTTTNNGNITLVWNLEGILQITA